jgi:hypothetical protein
VQLKEISKTYNALDRDQRDDWMKAKIKAMNEREIVSLESYCICTNCLTVFKHAERLAKWNETYVSDREVELTLLRKKRQNEYVLSLPQSPVFEC